MFSLMDIRRASKKDAQTLADIGAETFWDTYHTDSHLEQIYIKNHINSTFTFEKINSELKQADYLYLIAENEDKKVGYARILISNSREEISNGFAVEISRIYLRRQFWGKNLGKPLLERCIEVAREAEARVVWLSVWKYNERAIKFYKKFGFEKVGEHIFDLAGSSQTDYLMELILE